MPPTTPNPDLRSPLGGQLPQHALPLADAAVAALPRSWAEEGMQVVSEFE